MGRRINPESTVGQLVSENPARSRFFESVGIDYCCGGKIPLTQACQAKGLDTATIVTLLERSDAQAVADRKEAQLVDADAMDLHQLADHIENTHHAYLRNELPRLDQMTQKVFQVHGDKEPRLAVVRQAFVALRDELMQHMVKEEQLLFPMIREMSKSDGPCHFHCGSIANPIRQMEAEHEHAGDALATMREATDGYQPPVWACNTYRAMLDGLAFLEHDMHQHVHKENNVLFPKAIALESKLAQAVAS